MRVVYKRTYFITAMGWRDGVPWWCQRVTSWPAFFLACTSQGYVVEWRILNFPWKQRWQESRVAIMIYSCHERLKWKLSISDLWCQIWRSIFLSNIRSLFFSLFSCCTQKCARYRRNYFIMCRHMYLLTMLFIFEDDEPALCFLRLLTSSAFPSFVFKIILLLPAVPSDEDRSRLSINLPSRYGLRLLARTIKKTNKN